MVTILCSSLMRGFLSTPFFSTFIIRCFYSHRCPTSSKGINLSTAALPATVRLLETKGRHFSEITVFDFLPSITDASAVPQHGSAHFRLGNFFPRFTALDPPCSAQMNNFM
jgi:hypothetical protein